MATLTYETFYYSLLSGAKRVIEERKDLNEINVFPVPDGDTGSNLASMMQTIINDASLDSDYNKTLISIADAALVGARGNSGIIFAQYINGIVDQLEDKDHLDMDTFAAAIKNAVPYAYKAISNPVEGTMITVMREFSEAIESLKDQANDFTDLLSQAYEKIKVSLLKTRDTLSVLTKANVVDAGAKGFVHFIEGFLHFIKTGVYEESKPTDAAIAIDHVEHDYDQDETYRYCTEALLSGDHLDKEAVRSVMESFGDSLVVAGNARKLRLHIHTNTPQHVFHALRPFGTIDEQKVDDMQAQYALAHNRKYKIALVTDSIADLPKSFVDNHQIYVVPINLLIEDSNYYDKLTITSEQFYSFMDSLEHYPTSAQPNVKTIENVYSFLSSYFDEIIAITVSEKMSGTYNVFNQAKERFDNDKTKIHVINSKQNSGAEGLLVMKAAELIEAGKSMADVVETIESLRDQTEILVSVQTLKYMVRSGRVKKTVGLIGKITNLKPVISIDDTGEGIIFSKGFSLKGSTKKIKKHVKDVMAQQGIDRYAIVHANAKDRAHAYQDIFKDIIGKDPEYIMDISTIVAMSAGIGTVAIAYIKDTDSVQ